MIQALRLSTDARAVWHTLLHVLLGSIFLTACSQISIPLHPVPMTLQTFGVFVLAMGQGGRLAALSVALYLVEATLGLPVLAGGYADPLWMIGPRAGYLIGFPIAAYVIGELCERDSRGSVLWTGFTIFCGQMIIYTLGVSWLSGFVGLKTAFALGVVPFIPTAFLKILAAVSIRKVFYLNTDLHGKNNL